MYREKGNHVITCVTEHKAVVDTCRSSEKQGLRVTYLPVQKDGRIDLNELRAAITDKTILITIMTANNEIGVIQPIAEIGTIAKEKGSSPHRRCAGGRQGALRRHRVEVDLVSISGPQDLRPKGVGALYVRRRNPRVLLAEQISGGGHERGMRSGTLNVTGIVGLARRRSCASRRWRRHRAAAQASRSAERAAAQEPRRDLHQRLHGAPAPAQPQYQLCLRRR